MGGLRSKRYRYRHSFPGGPFERCTLKVIGFEPDNNGSLPGLQIWENYRGEVIGQYWVIVTESELRLSWEEI